MPRIGIAAKATPIPSIPEITEAKKIAETSTRLATLEIAVLESKGFATPGRGPHSRRLKKCCYICTKLFCQIAVLGTEPAQRLRLQAGAARVLAGGTRAHW